MRLSPADARQRFATARVARLATAGPDGLPHVVPVTFALAGDQAYTAVDGKPKASTDLRRLRNIRASPRVALLADHYAEDWDQLWWARADGIASVLPAGPEAGAAARLLAGRYPQYRENPPGGPVIRIEVTRWSGWTAAGG